MWKTGGVGVAALLCVSRAGAGCASPGFLLGSCSVAWHDERRSPMSRCRSPMKAFRSRRRGARRGRVIPAGGQAFCVRTCDGRYFPLAASDNASRAASCNNFCPASDTKVVYGSNIDSAATDNGKPYSELPNAFRYRTEIVAGCTCNGKDPTGLRRSRSRMTRRYVKVTSSPVKTASSSPAAAPINAAPR